MQRTWDVVHGCPWKQLIDVGLVILRRYKRKCSTILVHNNENKWNFGHASKTKIYILIFFVGYNLCAKYAKYVHQMPDFFLLSTITNKLLF